MLGKDYADQNCALARAMEVVGQRWTLLIVRDAFYGVRRFSDFAAHMDIPRAVLADRLRHLVDTGVLQRQQDPGDQRRVVYELTDSGRELWPALHMLMSWGTRFHQHPMPVRRFHHAPCGTELDQHARCPVCQTTPLATEVETTAGQPSPDDADPVTVALASPRRLLAPLDASTDVAEPT